MADTGAPWNLPYPLPTDLVRDGADAIKDLAEQVAVGLDAAGNAGIGSNVVQTLKTDTFTTATTGSWVDITGMSAVITPTDANAKVLVQIIVNAGSSGASELRFRVLRNSTVIGAGTGGGGLDVSLRPTIATQFLVLEQSIIILDTPSTISATTYKLQVNAAANTTFINRRGAADDDRTSSSITLIEVAS